MTASPLGRGLGSLIPSARRRARPAGDHEARAIPLDHIQPNPKQPRSAFGTEGLEELMASIRAHGILQPLVVTQRGSGYEIIAGERRFRAAKALGMPTVPAIIRDVTEQQQLELALVENLQRENLNPLEEADAYQQLLAQFNLTQEEVAKRVGKSRSYVANTLRLLALPQTVQAAMVEGRITEGHAKVIASLSTTAEQESFLQQILNQKLSVRDTEALARTKRPKTGGGRRRPPDLQAVEDALQKSLGTKVRLAGTAERGTIAIVYFSREELRSLLQRLTSGEL